MTYSQSDRLFDAGIASPKAITTFWFVLCLIPLSLPGGYSANYIFVFTAIWGHIAAQLKFKKPTKFILIYIGLSIFSFSAGSLLQLDLHTHYDRRVISFFLSMTVFAFCFLDIKSGFVASFELALIVFSIIFSIVPLFGFATLELDAGTAKDEIGTQRIGYVFLFAFWLVAFRLLHNVGGVFSKIIYPIILVVISTGLIMTFSRTSLIALVGSLLCFPILLPGYLNKAQKFIKILFVLLLLGSALFVLGWVLFDTIGEFMNDRLFTPFAEGLLADNVGKRGTSEGDRVFMWSRIIEFVTSNPLTGAGFLGPWIIRTDAAASAHSQYFDVFFRVGFLGFFVYLYLIYRIARVLKQYSHGLFMGLIASMLYGVTHETFRDSQGAFIFAVILGIYSTVMRSLRHQNRE